MDVPTTILFITSGAVVFLSLIVVSFKTGFISFSMLSMTRKDQPKFNVEMAKIRRFTGLIAGVFVLNVIYGFVLIRDMSQASGILLLSFINTAFIAYALVYL